MLGAFLFSLFASPYLCAPDAELISSLPNLVEPMRSKQYSGYLNISNTKALYYWYIESENDPSTDPVVLWLNGGPGCSSLEGLFVEMGPYRTHDFGDTVHRNPWTWNRNVSIIYLDAPAGVGFSIRTGNQSDWKYTDDEVANDNHLAIAKWFQKFPERKNNSFYVAGESYGGTYVPMLSARLTNDSNFPHFMGMAIGNGCMDDKLNLNSGVHFNYNHGFIDEEYYRKAMAKCCSTANYVDGCDFYSMTLNESNPCYAEASYLSQANFYTGLDPYFLYYSCYKYPSDDPHQMGYPTTILQSHLRSRFPAIKADQLPSCYHYNDSTVYLQRDDLRKALNIPDSVPKYQSCNDAIAAQYDFGKSHYLNQAANVKTVMAAKKRVMLFNGDTDSICNAIHNAQFVAGLNMKKVSNETTWNDENQQPSTCGLITRYQGIDFLTVRGAGHFVSSSNEKPKEAFQMFINFIFNRDYSTTVNDEAPTDAASATSTMPPTTTSSGLSVATVSITIIALFLAYALNY